MLMRRKLIVLLIAGCIAVVGQWALVHIDEHSRAQALLWLAYPGFMATMILGLDGEPGTSPIAAYVQLLLDTFLYFAVISAFLVGYRKLMQLKAER
jgi:hypothetical protein